MATLANQGVASQGIIWTIRKWIFRYDGAYTPPSGYVVVAITCLADTSFDTLNFQKTGTSTLVFLRLVQV